VQPSGISAFLLTLLLLAAPVPAGLWFVGVTERAWGERSASLAWVALLTVWCALHTALGLALGTAGLFARGPLALAEGALLAAGWLALWRTSAQRTRHCSPITDHCSLTSLHSSPFTLPSSLLLLHPSELALVGALAAMACVHFVALAAQPTPDWDSIAFHLPPMFHWVQTGRLGVIPDIAMELVYRYPYGGELLDGLFVLPYRSDFLAALPNLASWVLLGAGVHASARLLGARRSHALAAGALLLSLTFVTQHVATMHVDLTMAGHFAAALALGLAWIRRPSAAAAAPAALAVGLLLGTRLSAPAHLLALSGAAGALVVTRALSPVLNRAATVAPTARRTSSKASPWCATWGMFAGATLLGLLIGGYWYARNWVEVGSPFGLVRAHLAGLDLMPHGVDPRQVLDPAVARTSTMAYLFRPARREDWAVLGGLVSTELGWPFVALALAALAGSAVALVRGDRRRRAGVAVLLALFAVTLWLYTIVPNSGSSGPGDHITAWCTRQIRFGLSALAVLAVLGAVGASALRVPRGVCAAAGCAACVWAATLPGWPAREWGGVAAVGVAGVAAGGALARMLGVTGGAAAQKGLRNGRERREESGKRSGRGGWGARVAWTGAALLIFAASIHYLHREHEVRRGGVYGGLSEYVDEKIPPGETIAQLNCGRTAPLYGSHLGHRVVAAFSLDESPADWEARLRREGVRHLAVGPLQPEVWRFDFWAGKLRLLLAPDGPFVPEFGHDPNVETVLYRLREPADTGLR
jgi:hypothetical protein